MAGLIKKVPSQEGAYLFLEQPLWNSGLKLSWIKLLKV